MRIGLGPGMPGPYIAAVCVVAALAQAPQVENGTLPITWITGGPNCLEVPDWLVHEYNPTFYILRESGCTNYEKPFLYLILGKDRALLVDTGAGESTAAEAVGKLLAKRGKVPLVVAHSHGHGDHVAGDAAFQKMDGVTFVAANVEALQKAFGIAKWPEEMGSIDLGDRVVDVIPIPGHQAAHVAYYDRRTGILLTGDHLYPGRLYVTDFPAYLASTRRMVEFTATRPGGPHPRVPHRAVRDAVRRLSGGYEVSAERTSSGLGAGAATGATRRSGSDAGETGAGVLPGFHDLAKGAEAGKVIPTAIAPISSPVRCDTFC